VKRMHQNCQISRSFFFKSPYLNNGLKTFVSIFKHYINCKHPKRECHIKWQHVRRNFKHVKNVHKSCYQTRGRREMWKKKFNFFSKCDKSSKKRRIYDKIFSFPFHFNKKFSTKKNLNGFQKVANL
jgi:hypothetical protein